MATFKEIFGKLATSSPGDFHEVDEFTRVYREDVLLQVIVDEDSSRQFNEPWLNNFPDKTGHRYDVHVMYGGSRLHTFLFVSADGGRYMLPLPTSQGLEIDDLQFTLARLIANTAYSIDEGIKTAGIKVVRSHHNSLMY
ncbi:hypothetical protein [Myxococcus sp. CA040A]|uniref:hypothetical protein n=1 Tax=Myxococcus sp. CA040A TaxID=2741738 RepID=UPI00157ADC36|nr:hypothetical protein [Myxococcus sp. CA040A]NTX08010.1 hypothetical protein [Myxococcus sp. CA040A]